VKLFKNDEGYIKTELHHDLYQHNHYVTIDYWSSKEACVTFRNAYCQEFELLDQRGEALTEKETLIGEFELVED
jgi:heme-degrading monooxygenase HmoA